MNKGFLTALVLMMTLTVWMPAYAKDDVDRFPECKYCGMYRKNFRYSRMLVIHKDGSSAGLCSINCAAIDYVRKIDNPPGSFKVGDYKTRKLIDAERAYWVIGGSKPGVMAETAKWAFKKQRDAEEFIKRHGGSLTTFDEAMKASYEDMYEDMRSLALEKLEHARSMQANSQGHGLN